MFRRIVPLLLLVALIVAVVGCSGAAVQTGPAQKVTIAHGGSVIPVEHPGQYLPNVMGWTKDENLDVTVQAAGGSQQALQLLAAGQADFIQVNPETIAIGRQQNVPVVTVYSVVTHHNARLAFLKDGTTHQIADLKGKVIGVPSLASGNVFFAKSLLKEAGLDPEKDVQLVPTGFGADAGENLKSGKVNALSYWTGFFAGLASSGMELDLIAYPPLKNAPGHVLATTETYLKEHPDIVAKIGRNMARAAVFAAANPEATVQAFWKAYPDAKPKNISDDEAMKRALASLKTQLEDMRVDNRPNTSYGWNDPDGWSALVKYMVDTGQLTAVIPNDKLFNNDHVKEFNNFDANKVKGMQVK